MEEKNYVIRNHKDTVFRMIFRDKRELLELYNALNSSDYKNPEELTVYTLENAIYMNVKNDISFLLDSELNLYEHQASFNPNMPLMEKCKTLREYCQYVECVRKHAKQKPIAEAVNLAVEECIGNGILSEFLSAQRAEVIAMSIFEYNEEEELKKLRNSEFSEGKAEGKAEAVLDLLEELGAVPDTLRDRIMQEKDPVLLRKWLRQAAKAVSVEQFAQKAGINAQT